MLTYLGLEGFVPNLQAGPLGVDIHCNYSHSLAGSVILSLTYGAATGFFTPGFLASFSHFIQDMLVHNQDMLLDPVTNITIGGTNMWSALPAFSFYFELGFCLVCAAFTSKDQITLVANGFILFFHIGSKSSTPQLLAAVLQLPEPLQRNYIAIVILASFIVPGLIIGYILNFRKNQPKNKLN
ncbi:hypothetical protein K493DRAFT_319832 [Basidiobolus meristosporus CBS 931.73]|uniref:Uncharacterized protein n=1 Tax=Basidiobolus meristosporus CBS 931.73 TaxID=1314790 RepID=A0A1Y1XK66_9FUNG|nr:hypothetical protein K493DRAFT_319832 [Basidiobolus meristosporus CBS 931.73]|eukprot:ORX86150.1 hypothetical protein K493DRAFT_319832 [Basidiobolus meristosporus CBS 931.73]